MPDWNSRLVVKYDAGSGNAGTISPIDSFSPSFALNAEVFHSIEQTHMGVIYNPQSISFTLTVKTIGDVAAKLTTLAMNGTRFKIELQESDNGSDWSYSTVVLSDCIITSATPSTASVSGAPTATFSGFSMSSTVTPKTGQAVEIP